MLPCTLVETVPKKLWEPVLHYSFDELETGGGGNTLWILDHCSKLHSLVNSSYAGNFGTVGSVVKMIGLVRNLTVSMSHADAEPKRLRFTIVAANWLLSIMEGLNAFEHEEFAEAMVDTGAEGAAGKMSKVRRLMKETDIDPAMLKKMHGWFKAHNEAFKSGSYEELTAPPDSAAPSQPSLLNEVEFGALGCGHWQNYQQYKTCWDICSFSRDGERLVEQYAPLLRSVISKCMQLYANRFPVTAITRPLELFASKPQNTNDDFDIGTVAEELIAMKAPELDNNAGSSAHMETDTVPDLTTCFPCGDKTSSSATYPDGMTTMVCDDLLCYSMAIHVEVTKRSGDPTELETFTKSIQRFTGSSTGDLGHLSPQSSNGELSAEGRKHAASSLRNRGLEILEHYRHWYGMLGLGIGRAGNIDVDALMVPASPMLSRMLSETTKSIEVQVGQGFEEICSQVRRLRRW